MITDAANNKSNAKGWQELRIKDIALVNARSLNIDTDFYYQFKYVDIGNVNQNGIINEPETVQFNQAPSRARRIVIKGDVIVSTVRTYLKAVAYFDFNPKDYIVSTGFAVLSHSKRINPAYLSYSCQSDYFIDSVIENSKGVSYPAINSTELSSLSVYYPPFNEQIAIAEYLNTKTQVIDKKVSLLEKKIGYYQELRKSLINETVTKGLDKNVKLKDSGIEWIGQIPGHWEVKRGKDIFKEISRKNRPDLPLLAASQKQGVVLKSMLENRSMEAQKSFEIFKWVKPKDFVISLRSFEGGIETAYYEGIISPAYTVFNFRTNGNITSYFTHLFKAACFIDFLQSSITGIRDGQSVKFIELEKAFFAIPPVSEQIQMADYLTEKTTKIDQIITNIQTQIITLKELRKTLINDVVTGKIKVSHE